MVDFDPNLEDDFIDGFIDMVNRIVLEAIEMTERAIARTEQVIERLDQSEKRFEENLKRTGWEDLCL
jgi:hypothetical protein